VCTCLQERPAGWAPGGRGSSLVGAGVNVVLEVLAVKFSETIVIGAPPEAVFDYMTNLATLRDWQTTRTSVKQLTDGPPSLGTRVRERTKPPGAKEFEQIVEFTTGTWHATSKLAGAPSGKFACIRGTPGGACVGLRPARHPASHDRAAPTSSGCPRTLVYLQYTSGPASAPGIHEWHLSVHTNLPDATPDG
jgi:hypothetical protein